MHAGSKSALIPAGAEPPYGRSGHLLQKTGHGPKAQRLPTEISVRSTLREEFVDLKGASVVIHLHWENSTWLRSQPEPHQRPWEDS